MDQDVVFEGKTNPGLSSSSPPSSLSADSTNCAQERICAPRGSDRPIDLQMHCCGSDPRTARITICTKVYFLALPATARNQRPVGVVSACRAASARPFNASDRLYESFELLRVQKRTPDSDRRRRSNHNNFYQNYIDGSSFTTCTFSFWP